jgi:hypothetical protein
VDFAEPALALVEGKIRRLHPGYFAAPFILA